MYVEPSFLMEKSQIKKKCYQFPRFLFLCRTNIALKMENIRLFRKFKMHKSLVGKVGSHLKIENFGQASAPEVFPWLPFHSGIMYS